MTLTLCVPTMPQRKSLLSRLLWYVEQQEHQDRFEVIIHSGSAPLGEKMNRMFTLSQGDYVAAVDDDDWISPRYMTRVFEALGPDFVGFDFLQTVDDRFSHIRSAYETAHNCPVRTELARQVYFGSDYFDDMRWAAEVEELVETRTHIPEVLYFYDHRTRPGPRTETWGESGRSVGWWPHHPERYRWL